MLNKDKIYSLFLISIILFSSLSCSVRKISTDFDGPPDEADLARAYSAADVTVKWEPKSKYGNPKSYVVFGKKYKTLKSADGYHERGLASWYGRKFHGQRTSSGETYDMFQLTAAHKTLPIPCYAEVWNLENNRKMILRINDRGPFHKGRIIDLSYAAAVKLGVIETGTARVEVRTVTPATLASENKNEKQPLQISENPVSSEVFFQLGAFSTMKNAEQFIESLVANGIELSSLNQHTNANRSIFKVLLGPMVGDESTQKIKIQLEDIGIIDYRVIIN
jgi:rare lipoprotein A